MTLKEILEIEHYYACRNATGIANNALDIIKTGQKVIDKKDDFLAMLYYYAKAATETLHVIAYVPVVKAQELLIKIL